MPEYIDFKALRKLLAFADVLAGYGVNLNIKESANGKQHKGMCPLNGCGETNPRKATFSANIDRKIWRCFRCGLGGNVLDFIVIREGLDRTNGEDVRKASKIAREKFLGGIKSLSQPPPRKRSSEADTPSGSVQGVAVVNEVLDFELKSIDPRDEWFDENGFSPGTIQYFGLGVCNRGWLKGRVAIPIRNRAGLIGYAGRLLEERSQSQEIPLYVFPETRVRKGVTHYFSVSDVVYHRDGIERKVDRLFVVREMEEVWWLWQHGYSNVVSLPGGEISETQCEAILSCIQKRGAVGIVTGRKKEDHLFAKELIPEVVRRASVRWYFPKSHETIRSMDAAVLKEFLGAPDQFAL